MRTWAELEEDQQAELAKRVLDGADPEALALEYGLKFASFDRLLRRKRSDGSLEMLAGLVEKEADEVVAASCLEPWRDWQRRVAERPDWRELVQFAMRGAELQEAYRPDLRRARRVILTERPVLVAFASDFHLGSPHTDYHAFLETSDRLKEQGYYLVIVGPDLEAAFKWFGDASAVLNQVLPPWLQIETYRQWLDWMMPNTLAVCGDNHVDQRLERYLGDIDLVWRDELPYFRAYGILDLAIGPSEDSLQEYRIVLSHKWPGHSIYHNLQPALRMMREIHPLADVYVTAHTHEPAHLEGVFYPEARGDDLYQQFIVTGTFKTGGDLYSLRSYGPGVYGVPVVQFWPDEHRLQYYSGPHQVEAIRRFKC